MDTQLKLSDIKLNKQTQSRTSINQDVVNEYCDAMLNDVEFPAIAVFFDGIDYYLVDGYHRYFATKKTGAKEITATVMNGSLRDAILYAVGVNSDHGLQRSHEDKRKAVMTLLDDLEWAEWSDREIARKCNVSFMTVGRVRKSLNIEQTDKKFINRHGTESVMKTENVGKKPELVPQMPEPEVEDEHLQELANANIELAEENTALKDRLAVKALDVTEEEKTQYIETVAELRATIKTQEAEIAVLKSSRDQLLSKNADMLKQISYWKKKAEKAA
jgi:ParB-like chromosome segregation protein Spo0J